MPHDHSHDHHDDDHHEEEAPQDHHNDVEDRHDHDHHHDHHDPPKNERSPLLPPKTTVREEKDAARRQGVLNRLYVATFLCSCFIVVEIVGGLWAHSLAILSDAAHLFADLASFAVAIAASYLASLPATQYHTFGLRRTESLAALFSMLSLALVSVGLGYEAVSRLVSPPDTLVQGKIMSGIASIGVLVNIALAFVLGENHVHLPGMDHDGHCHEHSHEHHGGGHHDDHHDHDGHHTDDEDYHSCEGDHHQHGSHDHDHDDGHNNHGAVTSVAPGYGTTTSTLSSSKIQMEHGDIEAGIAQGHDHHHGHGHNSAKEEEEDNHGPCFELHHKDEVVPLVADDCGGKGGHDDHLPMDHPPHDKEERNINLHAAYLHVMGDLAQSVAVLIAGLVIWVRPDWHFIDPILTLLFACLVLYSTVGVLRMSMSVLLEGTPPNVSWQKVYEAICRVPNVQDVHDLHIWSIAHGLPTLSVHCQSDDPMALHNVRDACLTFGISHATIQIQPVSGSSCVTCGDISSCTKHFDDHRN